MTRPGVASWSTLAQMLADQAAARPDALLYRFLPDGVTESDRRTFGSLDARTRALAVALAGSAAPGTRVLLLFPPGLELVDALLGCVRARLCPVPVFPPSPGRWERDRARLQAIVEDAGPTLALTTRALLELAAAEAPGLRWLAVDDMDGANGEVPTCRPDDVAVLQYTSGSTGTPRGVPLTHRNLLHNLATICAAFELTTRSVGVIWLPPYHDMGLIGGLLAPIFAGFVVHLMPPATFVTDPLRWLAAIDRERATVSGGPDFAYAMCVRRTSAEQRARLDLSRWRVAFVGAEPVRARTLAAFTAAFAPAGFCEQAFYPCYGLAEATLLVTGGTVGTGSVVRPSADPHAPPLTGCGHVQGGQRVEIVDRLTGEICPEGQVGEIVVTGPSVARGYFGRTDGPFVIPAEGDATVRTGDLGLFAGGELFVTGRARDLIIVRGRNLYPQDLEASASAAHPALRPGAAAAFAIDLSDGEAAAIVIEARRGTEAAEVREIERSVRRAIARDHEVEVAAVVVVEPGAIPFTSSGKVQRGACRALYLHQVRAVAQGQDFAWPEPASLRGDPQALARTIAGWISARTGAPLNAILLATGSEGGFAALGLDSLAVAELAHALERVLGVAVGLDVLLGARDLGDLGARIAMRSTIEATGDSTGTAPASGSHAWAGAATRDDERPVTRHDAGATEGDAGADEQDIAVSRGEAALWFDAELTPTRRADWLVRAATLVGPLELAALRAATDGLVVAHPILRARYVAAGERIVRRLGPAPRLEVIDAAGWSEERVDADVRARVLASPSLDVGPLLALWLYVGDAPVLVVAAHHIVVDQRSLARLAAELGRRHEAARTGVLVKEAPPLGSVAAFARWQAARCAGPGGAALADFWRSRLVVTPTTTATDVGPRPARVIRRRGGTLAALDALARAAGVTRFVVTLTVFAAVLARWRGRPTTVVATPADARTPATLGDALGYLVNLLPLTLELDAAATLQAALAAVDVVVRDALAHRDYPFAAMVEDARHAGGALELDAVFTLHEPSTGTPPGLPAWAAGLADHRVDLGGLVLMTRAIDPVHAAFDLHVAIAADGEGGLTWVLTHDVERISAHAADALLMACTAAMAAAPAGRHGALAGLMRTEELRVLRGPEPPATRLAHQEMTHRARATPDAVALSSEQGHCSYAGLRVAARRLAAALQRAGVGRGDRVGVCLERTPGLVIAVLAILEAGAAYVPLDPGDPPLRLAQVIAAVGVTIAVTTEALAGRLPPGLPYALPWPHPDAMASSVALTADDLACVLFTSGSTGWPRAVGVTHGGVATLLAWARSSFAAALAGRVMAGTDLGFDLSIFELLGPLGAGGTVVLAAGPVTVPPGAGLDLINTVPSVAAELLARGSFPATVTTICLAGEPLPWALVEQLREQAPAATIHNLYGPTETTIYATHAVIGREAGAPPIGRPIAGTVAVVVDAGLEPVPPGFPGELMLGGRGLARGYIGQPGATAARFIPDPGGAVGARLYRTGDRVRVDATGVLHFLGRSDRQVKLRGVRIEPAEIEAQLAAHPAVLQATANVHAERGGLLVAHVVRRPEHPVTGEALRRYLAERLPPSLVPAAVVIVDELPRTARGKLDHAALTLPPLERRDASEPRTALERELVALWCEMLALDAVGIEDDFFALGGHSLLASRLLVRVRVGYGVAPDLRELFARPTIAGLAEAIERARWLMGGQQPEEVERELGSV